MGDIEIGIKINVNIYLLVDKELPRVPFNVECIENIEETKFGTKILYKDSEPFMSTYEIMPYEVLDPISDVRNAIENAINYKIQCLDTISNVG